MLRLCCIQKGEASSKKVSSFYVGFNAIEFSKNTSISQWHCIRWKTHDKWFDSFIKGITIMFESMG
jgi:hypothetical protein